jgi:DNA-binding response OmpR family regulator
MLNKFLIKKGYEVYTALDCEEALSVVREERPHIVLLDIKMPKMNGIECLKRIKEIDKEVGVIMITAVTQEETEREAMKLDAFDYITKPLSLKYLEDCLMVKLFQMTA